MSACALFPFSVCFPLPRRIWIRNDRKITGSLGTRAGQCHTDYEANNSLSNTAKLNSLSLWFFTDKFLDADECSDSTNCNGQICKTRHLSFLASFDWK